MARNHTESRDAISRNRSGQIRWRCRVHGFYSLCFIILYTNVINSLNPIPPIPAQGVSQICESAWLDGRGSGRSSVW